MKIEEELKMKSFVSEQIKANVNILFTAGWLTNRIASHIKKFGVSHEQFNVLRILRGQRPNAICQKDILSRMINRNSNLTKIIRKLIDKQLIDVQKSEVDRREYVIKITQKGLDLLEKIDVVLEPAMTNMENLSVSEAFHLNYLLDKMRDSKDPEKNNSKDPEKNT